MVLIKIGIVITVLSVFINYGQSVKLSAKCLQCQATVIAGLEYFKNSEDPTKLLQFAIKVCNTLGYDDDTCYGLITFNYPIVEYILDNRPEITAKEICSKFAQTNCAKKLTKNGKSSTPTEWDINIYENIPKKYNSAKRDENSIPLEIVHLTDIHYDPDYLPGSEVDCLQTSCCRKGIGSSPSTTAGLWGDYRSCDLPARAVDAVFTQILKKHKKIQALYYTGDTISHNIWETSKRQISESLEFLKNRFEKLSVPIVPILGNHDTHPTNLFAPEDVPEELNNSWLYKLTLNSWKNWIPSNNHELFRRTGYYSRKLFPKLRIIGLNSNVAYTANFWILLNETALYRKQLQWLADELLEAEQNEEFVHILSHIPPGNHNGDIVWQKQMRRIYSRFGHIIKGQFVGHTHGDELHLIYGDDADDTILGFALNGGGLTPWINVNPNYRVLHVDPNTYDILDYEQWSYNLTEANEIGKVNNSVLPNWIKLYSFSETYQVELLTPKNLHKFVNNLIKNETMLEQYQRFRTKANDYRHNYENNPPPDCDFKCRRQQICDIVSDVYRDYRQCYRMMMTTPPLLKI